MRTPAQHTGQSGEELAARFLEKKGFTIISRNYRYRRAEVDLIARKAQLLIFVEVKTRKGSAFGNPEDFVDSKKAALVIEAADHYIHQNDWQGNIRFDIIAILTKPEVDIQHMEDAFF
ncbi:putative endonuclease [Catalinimonas alkaloidigena]|uniref:YraN family protein n=1 Tax=Catalinimonas alkaloidigena TaxID=1075417 RepID=UPI00240620E5|nr:YraN family protein [Catalinimonas alkaloidigena]MDF9801011.1 putative endonuclease [Catalinimonas alkaloidigena]